jgi:sarcosine oxidase
MSTAFDVVVVGLGAVGSAVCHHLARLGVRVAGIDRFHPPHDRGSSHGLSRITRLALGEGEDFMPLALRSHELWRELEAASGERLYRPTGGLCISSAAADAQPFHGNSNFYARTVELARRHGIAHETLDASALRQRFPMFRVADDEHAYFERDAGVLYPERIVAAQLEQAARHGAVLRYGERVLDLHVHGRGGDIDVVTDRDRLRSARVVVASGPWLPGMRGCVPARQPRLLRVHRQVLYWFAAKDLALYAPERCPVWIWMHGVGAEGAMYGFPTGDGVPGIKVATEQYQDDADPDKVERDVSAAEVSAMHARHVAGRLEGATPQTVRTATCLYTCTTDASFVVRGHDDSDAITVVSACSGHGFKYSAAMGESIARHVAGSTPAVTISAWLRP